MKKKILFMFVLILAVMSIQIVVFADMDAPQIRPYNATVSNVDGARIYDYIEYEGLKSSVFEDVGSLEYGENIKIIYEVDIDGELYGMYQIKESQGWMLYIKIDDIEIIEKDTIEPLKEELKDSTKAIVLVDDVELYEGPAYGYGKKEGILTKGTELELYDIPNKAGTPWYFAKSNEYSGWVCILNGVIGIKTTAFETTGKIMEIMTCGETKVYKDTTYTEIIGTIPSDIKIENFWEIDAWSWGIYIEYDNISGYIQSEDYATNLPWSEQEWREYVIDYPAKIYKEPDFRSEVLLEEIPMGTKVEREFAANTKMYTWIYVTYNGISGWLFDMSEHVYDGETYQDVIDSYMKSYEEEENEIVIEEIDETKENNDNIKKDDTDDLQEKEIVKTDGYLISGNQIVLICVGFAVVLAVTVLVTIILVNKNNKKTEIKKEN